MQGVQSPAKLVHILQGLRLIQPRRRAPQLGRMGSLNTRFGALLKMGLQAFVPQWFEHIAA